jgi:hypothetical protein
MKTVSVKVSKTAATVICITNVIVFVGTTVKYIEYMF